jgi:hypothetical protein
VERVFFAAETIDDGPYVFYKNKSNYNSLAIIIIKAILDIVEK